ncbi:MAG: hypothetical protein WCT52_02690 [Candidatus Micrarchaeia archaeon]
MEAMGRANSDGVVDEVIQLTASQISNKEQQRKMGKIAAAFGFLVIAINIVDYMMGWEAVADATTILGCAFALIGSYYALKK